MITQQRLHELLNYDPITGMFTWKVSTSNRRKPGDPAGVITRYKNCTYMKVGVDGARYYAHRLAWLYVNGNMPSLIDHINGDGTNNSITNLRPADKSKNAANSKTRRDNKSGYKGVFRHPITGNYGAFISCKGKRIYLGWYKSAEKAHAVYTQAAKNYFDEFARVS